MMTSLLLFVMLAASQQLEQQQLQQLEQLNRQMDQQRRQLDRMLDVLDRQTQSDRRDQRAALTICSVEVRRGNGTEVRKVSPNAAAVVPLNLFSTVSRPPESCLPAEVRVTASYLDANENLI